MAQQILVRQGAEGSTQPDTSSNEPPDKKEGSEATGNGDGKKTPPEGNPDEKEGAESMIDDEMQQFWGIFLAAIETGFFEGLTEWMAEHRDFMETGFNDTEALRVRERLGSISVPEDIVAMFPERMRPLLNETGATGRSVVKKKQKR